MGKVNLAARRGAKANRRKAIVAQKRKAEAVGGTLAGQVARAAAAPIHCCLLSDGLFEHGIGTLLLARGSGAGQLVVGAFLLDTFGRGIKDIVLRPIGAARLDGYIQMINTGTLMAPVDPGYGRKLLRELARWSESRGFQAHPDFAVAERLFGDVDPQTCEHTFDFGFGGKALYVGDLSEVPLSIGGRMDQSSEQLEPDGLDHVVPEQEAAE